MQSPDAGISAEIRLEGFCGDVVFGAEIVDEGVGG